MEEYYIPNKKMPMDKWKKKIYVDHDTHTYQDLIDIMFNRISYFITDNEIKLSIDKQQLKKEFTDYLYKYSKI